LVARRLRRDATDVERILWRALRESGLGKFRRQHPIGKHIADFACPAHKLVVELDGGQHADEAEADAARTAELARRGWRLTRFWNGDVIDNLEGVLERIRCALAAPPPHPGPLRPTGAERGEANALGGFMADRYTKTWQRLRWLSPRRPALTAARRCD
jgi:very-short-patch-repair endonuclease